MLIVLEDEGRREDTTVVGSHCALDFSFETFATNALSQNYVLY